MSNLKILFLDIYKNESFRINKDVNGGFGTVIIMLVVFLLSY